MSTPITTSDFDSIRLKLASPDEIHTWSHGEVLKPETVNYRTQKPEKDGLFCEKIFGPSKDWECYCGKYRKIRYKGIICDKCGVEVTHSMVRRERMGHIDLAAPVSHIWFLRGVPSKIGLVLDLSVQNLEKIIYFANFIITKVNEEAKKEIIEQVKQEFKNKKNNIEAEYNRLKSSVAGNVKEKRDQKIQSLEDEKNGKKEELEAVYNIAMQELKELRPLKIITEAAYQDMSLKYGHAFEAEIGAEAIRHLLQEVNLDKLIASLEKEMQKSKEAKNDRLIRRAKLLKSLKGNNIKPEWMILTALPVIPPNLRPMVALDGGRFATSDLNDLYRRVINRNNRLKQLLELNAPEVICRNEKRMLQEAADALIDNSARHGKTVVASTGQKRMLKSIADMLKGKQGRFRQNLLGKRIDYSGRSVIVVGPTLKLDECGLPKKMALELFKPFIISKLIKNEYVYNVRSASRLIESEREEVWDILEEIVQDSYVLLNRAPTLHRLGIQAFKPKLIEGKAIQIHPLVCSAFNADFDGDQMAVHVPLTEEAKKEAANIMLASKNLLKPATGNPVMSPSKDIVWGCYYMTTLSDTDGPLKLFASPEEAITTYHLGKIKFREAIKVRPASWARRMGKKFKEEGIELDDRGMLTTSVGRIIFNQVVPAELPYLNRVMDNKQMGVLVKKILNKLGIEKTATVLDDLKSAGFKYLTRSGLSWSIEDVPTLPFKNELIKDAEKQVDEIQRQYDNGLLTANEKYSKVIETWTRTNDKIRELIKNSINKQGSTFFMIDSGARGSWGQLTQIMGMKGLVINPMGEIIELPVKANFKEGLDILEYFISTHGARKGTSDTALKTSSAGYLTRRLVDVAQDVIIRAEDCGDTEGLILTEEESKEINETLADRISGRFAAEDIKSANGKVIVKQGELIDRSKEEELKKLKLDKVAIRSLLTCKLTKGLCQKCYGIDLGYDDLVKLGTPVGIVAAQSIGEPGTQLTMRTFHSGGVAGDTDITQGLPRVDELFETRTPKRKAYIAEVSGKVTVADAEKTIQDEKGKIILKGMRGQKLISVFYQGTEEDKYYYKKHQIVVGEEEAEPKAQIKVKDGDKVGVGTVLFIDKKGKEMKANAPGEVKITDRSVDITHPVAKIKEYVIPRGMAIWVKTGDEVLAGDPLTEGSMDMQQLYKFKGRMPTQKYLIKETKHIYASQGQPLNDKHVEVIARQLFSKVYVKDAGGTYLLPGETIDKAELDEANKKAVESGQAPAEIEERLLGISKVSLATHSWLSAASFQETSRVLINAAMTGKVDHLEGLKENVIIGRLIPAGTGFRGKKNVIPSITEGQDK